MLEHETSLDYTVMTGIYDSEAFDSRSLTELIMTQSSKPRRKGYGISLYLPATRDPIEVWNEALITIGRRDRRQNIFPSVDLTAHHAVQLGVSRIHAQIIFRYGSFYIMDMGSANGTWVNKVPLKPREPELISHRDILRLGHLIIHVGACQYA